MIKKKEENTTVDLTNKDYLLLLGERLLAKGLQV